MSSKTIFRALALLLAAACFFGVRLAAQDEPSVAEAARRTRQQKQAAAKPARVIDNDSIPHAPSAPATPPGDSAAAEANPSTTGTSSSSNPTAKPEDASAPATEKGAADAAAAKKEKIEALKKQIADKKGRVDLQQRAIALAQDAFYSNPDHERDRDGKAKLDSMRADLEQEQAELADLQAKLAELGDSADSEPAPAPSEP